MASEVFRCEICSDSYDTYEHSPICLLCGHTLCRACLMNITEDSSKCPTCRQPITTPVDQLPVIYALIPSERNTVAETSHPTTSDRCRTHGCDLDNFCVNCALIICAKCAGKFHSDHRVESKKDIFNKDGRLTDFVFDLRIKIETNVGCLKKSISAVRTIRNCIEELEECSEDIDEWEDVLLSAEKSVILDLIAWKTLNTTSEEVQNELFKRLPRQWLNDAQARPNDILLANIKTRVDELHQMAEDVKKLLPELETKTSSLEASFGDCEESEHFTDDANWDVHSNDDVRRALASVQDDRRPSVLSVISTTTDPIRMLPEVLNVLGPAGLYDIRVKDFPSFWGTPAKTHGSLNTFIDRYGYKIFEFYGSFDDAAAVARERGGTRTSLGIGVSNFDDLYQIKHLGLTPNSVSVHGCIPLKRGINENQLSTKPQSLHVPDLLRADQGWLKTLFKKWIVEGSS